MDDTEVSDKRISFGDESLHFNEASEQLPETLERLLSSRPGP